MEMGGSGGKRAERCGGGIGTNSNGKRISVSG